MPRLPTASLTHVPARAQLTDASGNRQTWHKIAGSVKPRQAPSGLVLAGPGGEDCHPASRAYLGPRIPVTTVIDMAASGMALIGG